MRPEIVMRPAQAGLIAVSCSRTILNRATAGSLDSNAADLNDETRPTACLPCKLLVRANGNVNRWCASGALAGGTSGLVDAGCASHAAKALMGENRGVRYEK